VQEKEQASSRTQASFFQTSVTGGLGGVEGIRETAFRGRKRRGRGRECGREIAAGWGSEGAPQFDSGAAGGKRGKKKKKNKTKKKNKKKKEKKKKKKKKKKKIVAGRTWNMKRQAQMSHLYPGTLCATWGCFAVTVKKKQERVKRNSRSTGEKTSGCRCTEFSFSSALPWVPRKLRKKKARVVKT